MLESARLTCFVGEYPLPKATTELRIPAKFRLFSWRERTLGLPNVVLAAMKVLRRHNPYKVTGEK